MFNSTNYREFGQMAEGSTYNVNSCIVVGAIWTMDIGFYSPVGELLA